MCSDGLYLETKRCASTFGAEIVGFRPMEQPESFSHHSTREWILDYTFSVMVLHYAFLNKTFSVFNNKLPEYIQEEDYFLENTKGVVFEDENLRYYVFVKDFKINGSVSPLELEQDKIRNVLLNKNKIEYLMQLEDELYQNGLALKKIKIY